LHEGANPRNELTNVYKSMSLLVYLIKKLLGVQTSLLQSKSNLIANFNEFIIIEL